MDEKDAKILSLLSKNARMPKTEIAKVLGITEAAVRKRLAKLEKNGIILAYKPVINYKAANLAASLTGVDVDGDRLWDVVEFLKSLENVRNLYLTSGDHTIMAEIVATSTGELSEIHRRIEELEGVRRVCPAVILDVLK